jgi:hypothetical protein
MRDFNTTDRAVLASMQRMNAPEMKPLLTFLKNQFEETKVALIRAQGEHLSRLQGCAAYQENFINAVESAAFTLERLR